MCVFSIFYFRPKILTSDPSENLGIFYGVFEGVFEGVLEGFFEGVFL